MELHDMDNEERLAQVEGLLRMMVMDVIKLQCSGAVVIMS